MLSNPTIFVMNILDYYVILALAGGPQYGYAIREMVADESGGSVEPRAGTLYRVIARLITDGFVKETTSAETHEPHPGHARRYYMLTSGGRKALAAEAARLKRTATLAEKRLRAVPGRG